jgi:ligand-binding SRPBCC domain-containing protein
VAHEPKIGIAGYFYQNKNYGALLYLAMSKVYSLKRVQVLPISLERAWDFFSNPINLETITPDGMGFKTISKHHGDTMYAGQLIEYKVSPVLGIPLYWMTEITHVEDKKFFVDEQRFGPYSLWHHQHHFKKIDAGVEMTDIVHYKLPFWFLGDIANALFVKKQLQQIFDYRYKKVDELFGKVV